MYGGVLFHLLIVILIHESQKTRCILLIKVAVLND